jgi:hypothetical protein
MFRGLTLLAVSLLLSGCAAVAPFNGSLGSLLGGRPPAEVHAQTSIGLSQDDFFLVKTNVSGLSKGFSLLGFITIVPATLTKATSRMYAAAQMRTGRPQTIANLIVEQTSSYYILFGIPKVEVHADIVEFRPPVATSRKEKPRPAPDKPPEQPESP